MPGHDDYLDFNMWIKGIGLLMNQLDKIEKKRKKKSTKPKVYAWDRSAIREQKKLAELETDIEMCKAILGD